jgi:hypothetical protein
VFFCERSLIIGIVFDRRGSYKRGNSIFGFTIHYLRFYFTCLVIISIIQIFFFVFIRLLFLCMCMSIITGKGKKTKTDMCTKLIYYRYWLLSNMVMQNWQYKYFLKLFKLSFLSLIRCPDKLHTCVFYIINLDEIA